MCIGHGIRVAARAFVMFVKGHLKCLLLLLLFSLVLVLVNESNHFRFSY